MGEKEREGGEGGGWKGGVFLGACFFGLGWGRGGGLVHFFGGMAWIMDIVGNGCGYVNVDLEMWGMEWVEGVLGLGYGGGEKTGEGGNDYQGFFWFDEDTVSGLIEGLNRALAGFSSGYPSSRMFLTSSHWFGRRTWQPPSPQGKILSQKLRDEYPHGSDQYRKLRYRLAFDQRARRAGGFSRRSSTTSRRTCCSRGRRRTGGARSLGLCAGGARRAGRILCRRGSTGFRGRVDLGGARGGERSIFRNAQTVDIGERAGLDALLAGLAAEVVYEAFVQLPFRVGTRWRGGDRFTTIILYTGVSSIQLSSAKLFWF